MVKNKNKLPSCDEIYPHILHILNAYSLIGRSCTTFMVYDYSAEKTYLSQKEKEYVMSDGRNHWHNRVQGAKGVLVKKGFVITIESGLWKITDEGIEHLKRNC